MPTQGRNKTNVGWEHTLVARQLQCQIRRCFPLIQQLSHVADNTALGGSKPGVVIRHDRPPLARVIPNLPGRRLLKDQGWWSTMAGPSPRFCPRSRWRSISVLQYVFLSGIHVVPPAGLFPMYLQFDPKSCMQRFYKTNECSQLVGSPLLFEASMFLATFWIKFSAKLRAPHLRTTCDWT